MPIISTTKPWNERSDENLVRCVEIFRNHPDSRVAQRTLPVVLAEIHRRKHLKETTT